MTAGGRPAVAVVGGGIAGLAAAWELTGGAAGGGDAGGGDAGGGGSPSIILLEASPRLGGKLATVEFCGVPLDAGPDGFLGRRPEAVQLCREIGLADDLVPVGASVAAVWARNRRRPLPRDLVLAVPTRVRPVARSGILSAGGVLRLATDLVAPRPATRGPLGDRAIGPLVARKLGRQVVNRLVDPLVGGIHAGGVADASAAAVFPALLTAAQQGGSLMRALRRSGAQAGQPASSAGAGSEPLFWAVRGGFDSLVRQLAARLASRGVEVRTGEEVTEMARDGGRWVVETGAGAHAVDSVVVATPAGAAARLLAPHDPDAAGILRSIDYASVALVTLAFEEDAVPADLYGTGLLVPHGTPVARDVAEAAGLPGREPWLVTACTYLSAKWPHLERPGMRLLRASVGRTGDVRHRAMSDAELVDRVVHELRALVGVSGKPLDSVVVRWDEGLPQYRVHHLLRVAGVEAAARRLGGVAVAGAAYRGVGIPACIESGRTAAREVVAQNSV